MFIKTKIILKDNSTWRELNWTDRNKLIGYERQRHDMASVSWYWLATETRCSETCSRN